MPKQMVGPFTLVPDWVEVDVVSRTDSLSNALRNEGEKPRWTAQDAYILIHKFVSSPNDWYPLTPMYRFAGLTP